ncbi:MAG: ferritin family protein [Anaerolineae bacterium]|jgi:rubrerythrin
MAVFEAGQALEMAMRVEENGEAYYKAAAQQSDDPGVEELFRDLAGRERAHYRTFKSLAERVQPGPELPDELYGDYQAYLEAALDQALFSGPEKALRRAEQAEGREAVLQAAMGFEKDTMLFYYDLREMVSESDRETISVIIREEKQHLRRLARLV